MRGFSTTAMEIHVASEKRLRRKWLRATQALLVEAFERQRGRCLYRQRVPECSTARTTLSRQPAALMLPRATTAPAGEPHCLQTGIASLLCTYEGRMWAIAAYTPQAFKRCSPENCCMDWLNRIVVRTPGERVRIPVRIPVAAKFNR